MKFDSHLDDVVIGAAIGARGRKIHGMLCTPFLRQQMLAFMPLASPEGREIFASELFSGNQAQCE